MPRTSTRSALALVLLLVAPVASLNAQPLQDARPAASPAQADADLPLLRLDELLDEAQAANPSLRSARIEAAALAARRGQVASLPDPMVMGSYQPFPVLTARGTQRSQWRLEQQIPFPGKLNLRGEISDLTAEVAEGEAATYEQDLLLQVKRSYYELYRIQEQTRLVEQFQQRLADFERAATTKYEVGTGMQQAVLKAQVEKNALAQRLVALGEHREGAMETLSRLVNRPIEGEYEIRIPEQVAPLLDHDTYLDVARERRPERDALSAADERAERQIDLARREFLPDFTLSLNYSDIAPSNVLPTATGRDAFSVGLGVKVPLQRGRLNARLEEARLRASQVAARQEALETQFDTEIADLMSTIRREREQMALYRDLLVPQAETTVEATLSAYTTGRTDFLDLLDAERMLFRLRMGYQDALARHGKAQAGLERALGVSSLDELLQARR